MPLLEQEWRAYVSLTEPENRQSFVRTLRAVVDPRGPGRQRPRPALPRARLPTLIVWGACDRIIPVAHASAAHEAIPGSRLMIFDNSGHFPHTEEPERFVEVLEDFVDGTEGLELDEQEWRAILTAGPPA